MKRYVHAATNAIVNAKPVARQLQTQLEHDGFQGVHELSQKGRPGTTGARIRFSYRYHLTDDYLKYLSTEYASDWGEESAEHTRKQASNAYDNFILLQEMCGEDIGEERTGYRRGGFEVLHRFIRSYAADIVAQICPEAICECKFSGLSGIDTNADICIYVPK